jgi:subfamily B ATP-binding cassette protein MsbA
MKIILVILIQNIWNIEFKDVSFSYNTGNQIIIIFLYLLKNETVAIVGKSGSGKSTIANLIPRFYNHTSGDILIDGISVNNYSLNI